MNANWKWTGAFAYPVVWLLIYQTYVFVGVFAFGEWDPKFGGPWGTVEFLQEIGIVAVGVPILSYGLGLALRSRWFRAAQPATVARTGVLTAVAHLLLVAAYIGLASAIDLARSDSEYVQWAALFVLAVAPLPLVLLLSRRSDGVP